MSSKKDNNLGVIPDSIYEESGMPRISNIGGLEIQKKGNNIGNILSNTNSFNRKFDLYENEKENGYKLDWFSFTIDSEKYNIDSVLEVLNYNICEFESCQGRYFYNAAYTLSNYVYIYFNDKRKDKINGSTNTINYVFTGQGCTDLYNRNNKDIFDVFEKLIKFNIKVTRIDIAFDDFHKLLDFKKIEKKLDKAEFRSSKKKFNIVRTSDANQKSLGQTIYIGNARNTNSLGNSYVRMYDKKAQYEDKKQILPQIAEKTQSWQRYEISFSKKKADSFFYTLMFDIEYKYNIDKLYKATMRDIIEFLTPSRTVNKNRWNVCKWWDKFLDYDEKYNFTEHDRDVNIASLLDWLETSIIPNLKALEIVLNYFDYDLYYLLGNYEFLRKFSKKQMRLINDSLKLDENEIKFYLEKYLKLRDERS